MRRRGIALRSTMRRSLGCSTHLLCVWVLPKVTGLSRRAHRREWVAMLPSSGREWIGGRVPERIRLRRWHLHQCLLLLSRKWILVSSRRHMTAREATMALRGHMSIPRWRVLVSSRRLGRHGCAAAIVAMPRPVVMRRRHSASRPVGRDSLRFVPTVSARRVSARSVASRRRLVARVRGDSSRGVSPYRRGAGFDGGVSAGGRVSRAGGRVGGLDVVVFFVFLLVLVRRPDLAPVGVSRA